MIGRRGLLTTRDGLAVAVTVKDVRTAYGNMHVRVVPVMGTGEAWVSLERVTLASMETDRPSPVT